MTLNELVDELNALKAKWRAHVEYTDFDEPEDWGFCRGLETGYEYAADDLNYLIEKIEVE